MRGYHSSTSLKTAVGLSVTLHAAALTLLWENKRERTLPQGPLEVTIHTQRTHALAVTVQEIEAPVLSSQPKVLNEDESIKPPTLEIQNHIVSSPTDSSVLTNFELNLSRDVLAREAVKRSQLDAQSTMLAFRPSFADAVKTRKAEQARSQRVRRNQIQRLGYSSEQISESAAGRQDIAAITRIGSRCYSSISNALPGMSVSRGTQVAEVGCPGIRPWWEREDLSDLALYTGKHK